MPVPTALATKASIPACAQALRRTRSRLLARSSFGGQHRGDGAGIAGHPRQRATATARRFVDGEAAEQARRRFAFGQTIAMSEPLPW